MCQANSRLPPMHSHVHRYNHPHQSQAVNILPATNKRLHEIRNNQKVDEKCIEIREYCLHGWPAYKPHQPLLGQFWESQSHLSIIDDILLYDERIVISRPMRQDILDCIHQGHQGITKCRARARTSVWWPGLSIMIEQMVSKCVRHVCKRSTCANGTIDGFFIPVSPLGETCDGLVRTTWQSLSHRNRLLLSMDREQTS